MASHMTETTYSFAKKYWENRKWKIEPKTNLLSLPKLCLKMHFDVCDGINVCPRKSHFDTQTAESRIASEG